MLNSIDQGKIKKVIRNYSELSKNENTRYQNLWDGNKSRIREKVTIQNINIEK